MSRIAILYPGALGAALGKAIGAAGDRAITCLSGRSAMTRQRALAARFTLFPSVADVARCSEIIVSLVSPNSALMVANQFATLAANQLGENTRPIFIEANSVTPGTKKQIAEMLSSEGIACLDGAFLGPANRVGKENVLLLSGAGADSVAPIFRRVVETRVVGDEIGQAASLKMTMAILTKALPALFVEMVCVSAKQGQLGPALDLMRHIYPGVISFLERTLPTYPAQIARRVFELTEVRDWLSELGQIALMTEGAVVVLERLRGRALDSHIDWGFENLLYAIGESDLLSTDNTVHGA